MGTTGKKLGFPKPIAINKRKRPFWSAAALKEWWKRQRAAKGGKFEAGGGDEGEAASQKISF
jgi:hypothetical protein